MTDPKGDFSDRGEAEPVRDGGQREAAHYIMSEIGLLAALARRHDLGLLAYLLDMAEFEARDAFRQQDGRVG